MKVEPIKLDSLDKRLEEKKAMKFDANAMN